MLCPKCHSQTTVEKTITKQDRVFRYRRCKTCGYGFTTIEEISNGQDFKFILRRIKSIVDQVDV